ncbi:MAG: dipeptidase, partial [Candidatus Bathyarchaeia archaeon]
GKQFKIRVSQSEEERAKRLHRDALVIDGHSDTPCDVIKRRSLGERRVLKNRHLARWRKGGLSGIVASSTAPLMHFPTCHANYVEGGLNFLDALLQEQEESNGQVRVVTSAADLSRAKREGKAGMVLGFEGGEPVGDNLAYLRSYYRLGLRLLQLTWNQRNLICDGVAERSNLGLSNFGFQLIEELNKLGIVVDLAHISHKGLRDALSASKQPPIVSHTACRALYDCPRNLSDDELHAIREKGGVVGIAFYPRFFTEKTQPTVNHVLNHIDHAVELIGARHIGLGPDFIDYCLDLMMPNLEHSKMKGYSENIHHYPKGAEDVTKLPNITRGLVARGYSDGEIRNILGGSFLRIFEAVWK